jgi:hypothetical protein
MVADDEEAVEHAEGDGRNGEESIAAMASPWLQRKASRHLAGSEFLDVRFIQRQTVLSPVYIFGCADRACAFAVLNQFPPIIGRNDRCRNI